jgi:hypothetical protein
MDKWHKEKVVGIIMKDVIRRIMLAFEQSVADSVN